MQTALELAINGILSGTSLISRTETTELFLVALHSAAVYLIALVLVRLGEKRLLGKNTAFDVVGIILGSVLSRAINGSASLLPTIAAGLVLVGMHWLLAVLSVRSNRLSTLAKGRSSVLIADGKIDWAVMHKNHIGRRDLESAMRSEIHSSSLEDVKEARIERGGDISIVKAARPKILEVSVADGVQTVRIQID